MPLSWKDRIKVSIASGGVGTVTLNAAASGYRTFAAGDDGLLFPYVIVNGTAWETGYGTYTHSGTTVARSLKDSSSGSTIDAGTGDLYVDLIAAAAPGEMINLGGTEIAVTGATTATIGRMHVCTGTSADYTLTLPAASGNAGRCIGVRMGSASGLTKLVTIDGNASETIDGALTRVMWASESAILLCDGSNWFKISGKTRAMLASMHLSSNSATLTNGASTKIDVDASDVDTGLMVDTTNKKIVVRRAGDYVATGVGSFSNIAVGTRAAAQIYKNGGQIAFSECPAANGGYPALFVGAISSCSATDYMELYMYHNVGTTQTAAGGTLAQGPCLLSLQEVPSW